MKGKLALLVGAGIGYVLGTRDGRQRYENLKAQAKRTMNDPRVQEKASEMQHRVTDAASRVGQVASEKMHRKNGGMSTIDETGASGASTADTEPMYTSSSSGYPPS